MDTKSEILKIADSLIREKGYNAFSFSDISRRINIKNASVHYHFPTKTILGLAVITWHEGLLEKMMKKTENQNPLGRLNAFLSIYQIARNENKICIVGSLATDFYTVETEIQQQLKNLANNILQWLIAILEDGVQDQVFYIENTRTKALMIITNMMAAVQLTRLTGKEDFETIKQGIINDLIKNT